jgi:hypothetical protein
LGGAGLFWQRQQCLLHLGHTSGLWPAQCLG